MMNRELKFRVWHVTKKQWLIEPPIYSLDDYEFGSVTKPLRVQHRSSGEFLHWQDNVVIQQFTNILDIKRKEIYDGDILRLGKLNYEVMWIDYQWVATCPYYNKYNWPKFEFFGREARMSEVIGNVLENPELLK